MISKRLLFLLLGFASHASATGLLDQDIHLLLNQISESDCSFIRNGKSHTASEGLEHINKKYSHYEKEIDSIDTFIKLTASKSLLTGKEYLVECDGQVMTSANWMHRKATELGLKS